MIIILEGADGSGKSTLANTLQDNGYKLIKTSRGHNYSYDQMLAFALDKRVYIFDRALITSWVYRLLDGQPLDKCDLCWDDTLTLLTISKIIYCKTENDFEYAMQRGEDNITTKEKADKLRQLYDFVIGTIKLYGISTVIDYNWTKDDIQKVYKFIKEA